LPFDDFVSDVLCIPIFNSLIANVEVLVYNLKHIFIIRKKYNICLQQTLMNNLKELKEESNLYI